MVGMYTGLFTAQATGMEPLLTLPVAAVVGFLLGIICYYGFVKFLIRGPMVAQLLGTFGLMLFLRNLALLIFGSEDRALHHGILVGKSFDIGMGVIIPATKLAGAGLSVFAFWAVWNGFKCASGPIYGNSHRKNECTGLGYWRHFRYHCGGADRQLLVCQSLRRGFVYYDRLCYSGIRRVWKCTGGLFCRTCGRDDHRNPRHLGLFHLYL